MTNPAITGPHIPRPGHYQPLIVHSAQDDNTGIIRALSAIMHNDLLNDLVLLNFYDGLPISFGATVEHVRNGIVVMSVHSFQAVAMLLERMTFLKSELLPHWVMARVLKIDRESNLAYLALFSYVENLSEKRMHLRMKLPETVDASFHNSRQEILGAVREISFGGVALLTPGETALMEKEKGTVSLLLPDDRIDIPGEFLQYQQRHSLGSHIFQLKMDGNCEQSFYRFIYRLQSRIIDELKNLPRGEWDEVRL